MSNVPTSEEEADRTPPPSVTAIRDAIVKLIPKDDNIVSDVKIHDGLADILIRWRSLRWAACLSIAYSTPEETARQVDEDFRTWLKNTIKNMNQIPRHARVLSEMVLWLKENPDKSAWLYQKNKTEFTSANVNEAA